MDELYELKEMLCKELKEYGGKCELSAGTLEIVDKLAHAVKNIDRIIETYDEEEYSMAGGGSYRRNSYEGGSRSYDGRGGRGGSNRSYARGRGQNARRDSMGRYSREDGYSMHGDMIDEIRDLMEDAPNEQVRQEFQRFIKKLEQQM